ncbi:MAG: serine hydroxymethyltransferase [Chlamydiae bacterium RIFCSPHIGHO2_12_FULL_49_32]|nr:MAG: serine hydroxymethyltransferase [Chlamydiae bacterium RIFCSPHIGHO2_12_FULL_49_32]
MSHLTRYLQTVPEGNRSRAAIAYLAAIDHLQSVSSEVADAILSELKDQRSHLKLIASENFSSLAVQLAMGNLFTDKYAEGSAYHRFYAGCDQVDRVEQLASEEAKNLFGCDHAYVQPHSGADANLVAYWSVLVHRIQDKEIERLGKKKVDELTDEEYERVRQLLVNQKMMGLSLQSGGHLTHGYRLNVSSKVFRSFPYDVNPKTELIDYQELERRVKEVKPLILVAGYSAYPRKIDFARMREIADSVQAVLLVDMAHFAGLVAGKVFTNEFNPIPYADIVTSTTHKTLRGPRGGLILCKKEYREAVDKGCPLVLGGPLPHVMAAKAVAFKEAGTSEFQTYARQVVGNARVFAAALMERGAKVVTDGTDNHLVLIDVAATYGLTGRQAENALREALFTVNRNMIPCDSQGPWFTSGVRIGTPAVTTLGMKEKEMQEIAEAIHGLLTACKSAPKSRALYEQDVAALKRARVTACGLLERFPLYPEIVV